jgi:5-methylcytosine-specific restriction endonuclease McrA
MKSCAQCGSPFTPKRRDQRFCARACNSSFHRDSRVNICSAPGCGRAVRAKGLCNTDYNRTYHQGSQRRFPGNPDERRRLLRIKTQRRRARERGVDAEAVDRDIVGKRDKWKCGVCGRRVNNALSYPDPQSASLDHILPISQGGAHTYANVRITHLTCNTVRGNRGGGEQLLLVG